MIALINDNYVEFISTENIKYFPIQSDSKLSSKRNNAKVSSAFVLFNKRYQPDWKVYIPWTVQASDDFL